MTLSETTIKVPDIGGDDNVEVIEISVAAGDHIEAEQTLIVLESDKASMEIPSPRAGVVKSIDVAVGDKVSEGSAIVTLQAATDDADEDGATAEQPETGEQAPADTAPATSAPNTTEPPETESAVSKNEPATTTGIEQVTVPDLGGASGVEVIEVNVAVGDAVAQDDTLLVLESDKASMEIPSPFAGTVKSLAIKLGDKLDEGALIGELEVTETSEQSDKASTEQSAPDTQPAPQSHSPSQPAAQQDDSSSSAATSASQSDREVYAGPAVRLMARELGVSLSQVKATGPRGRVLKEDIQNYVKSRLTQDDQGSAAAIPAVPEVDFAAFGEVEEQPLSRIQKLTAAAMQRSWLNVPHVSHFDEADVTDLEEFRALNKSKAEQRSIKLTPLPFLLKACAVALREHPQFNASLSASGDSLIYKQYCHIGVAMDTPAGLMVPVIRDVDKKGVWELAEEISALGVKGKEGNLSKTDLQGGCFTISSLGAIGGTGFTPIVNTPEVGILGVSRTQVKPVFVDQTFVPRKILPLTLSYDHRAVNGVDAGQFMTCLTQLLADIRRLLM